MKTMPRTNGVRAERVYWAAKSCVDLSLRNGLTCARMLACDCMRDCRLDSGRCDVAGCSIQAIL